MIKKYLIEYNSVFGKSVVLPFYERGNFGFCIDGIDLSTKNKLFDLKYIKKQKSTKDIDLSNATRCVVAYLDENLIIKAFILYCPVDKKYYSFRVDSQDGNKFRTQSNYIDANLELLTSDYEKSRKKKGKNDYYGIGDFKLIKDIDYFEYLYAENVKEQELESSNISRLIFTNNNKFTSDFIYLIEHKSLIISNIGRINSSALSNETMAKSRTDRKDCLLINFDLGRVEYFIYTYRPNIINHYLLFKNLGNNKFEFIEENTSFNSLFVSKTLKDIKYQIGSELASKTLSNMDYNDFCHQYIEFENDNRIDEEFDSEWAAFERAEIKENSKLDLTFKLESLLKEFGFEIKEQFVYFPKYELTPLAILSNNSIRIKQNRTAGNDKEYFTQVPFDNLTEIKAQIKDLLFNQPSSRLIAFESIVKSLIKGEFNESSDALQLVKKRIEEEYITLWDTDRIYPKDYLSNVYQLFLNWENENKELISKRKRLENIVVLVSPHASIRIEERIGKMSEEEKIMLAKAAFEYGKNPMHFYESDRDMFMFLQYKQSQYSKRTLRLYKNMIFVFTLEQPPTLVTCLYFESSYNMYMEHKN